MTHSGGPAPLPFIEYPDWLRGPAPAAPPPPPDVPVMRAAPPVEDPAEIFDLSNRAYDGYLIGAGGEYDPGTPLSDVHGVLPPSGLATHRIVYVNGILNSPEDAYRSLQAIAKDADAEVVGIYNASEGFFKDLWQSGLDKLDLGKNPAVDTLSSTVFKELTAGSGPINLMAHSQGALITSRALGDVKDMLGEQGYSRQEISQMMSRVHVETFGGAAWTYPDGPQYRHHV